MPTYVADFETTTTIPVRVWLWAAVNVDNEKDYHYGCTIDSFIEWTRTKNATYYFHNLKFDGKFILDYALRVLKFTKARTKLSSTGRVITIRDDNTFSSIISDMDQFYEIDLNYTKKRNTYYCAKFRDSMKKFGMNTSVKAIAKGYDVGGLQKLEIEYDGDRPEGYIPTETEYEYVKNDVLIVARALKTLLDKGLTSLTIGADAMKYYKKDMLDRYKDLFPIVNSATDDYIRKAYKGGYVMVNENIAGKDCYNGVSYDVHSMYPHCMTMDLPFGKPIYYTGRYRDSKIYPLYIQRIRCKLFMIKEGYLPTIQIKSRSRFYIPTEYVKCSNPEEAYTELTLTNIDLALFLDHYEVVGLEYIDGHMFQSSNDLFTEYIHFWYNEKCNSSGSYKQMAKLMLNNLYGKFAQATKRASKTPFLDTKTDTVRYSLDEAENVNPVYTAVAAFITSHARNKLIRAAQELGGTRTDSAFWYCDTDSIHACRDSNIKEVLDIHDSDLGKWGWEYDFHIGKYIRAKSYIELADNGKTIIKCAGMPESLKYDKDGNPLLTYDDFKIGYKGTRLQAKTVEGGVILIERPFEIKGV